MTRAMLLSWALLANAGAKLPPAPDHTVEDPLYQYASRFLENNSMVGRV